MLWRWDSQSTLNYVSNLQNVTDMVVWGVLTMTCGLFVLVTLICSLGLFVSALTLHAYYILVIQLILLGAVVTKNMAKD